MSISKCQVWISMAGEVAPIIRVLESWLCSYWWCKDGHCRRTPFCLFGLFCWIELVQFFNIELCIESLVALNQFVIYYAFPVCEQCRMRKMAVSVERWFLLSSLKRLVPIHCSMSEGCPPQFFFNTIHLLRQFSGRLMWIFVRKFVQLLFIELNLSTGMWSILEVKILVFEAWNPTAGDTLRPCTFTSRFGGFNTSIKRKWRVMSTCYSILMIWKYTEINNIFLKWKRYLVEQNVF